MDKKGKPHLKKSAIKRDRFVRIGENRVNKILESLDSLGKCSDKKNYEYDPDDVRKIFKAIDSKVRDTKSLFKNSNQRNNKFSLKS